MALEQTINERIKTAMLARDEVSLRGLRAIKAAILLARTSAGAGAGLSADEEIRLLQKLVKQRNDALEIFRAQGRDDLANKEQEEIELIEKFLPPALDPETLKLELRAIIKDAGANSVAEMGKVMGIATQKLAGRADGKTISAMVRELLST